MLSATFILFFTLSLFLAYSDVSSCHQRFLQCRVTWHSKNILRVSESVAAASQLSLLAELLTPTNVHLSQKRLILNFNVTNTQTKRGPTAFVRWLTKAKHDTAAERAVALAKTAAGTETTKSETQTRVKNTLQEMKKKKNCTRSLNAPQTDKRCKTRQVKSNKNTCKTKNVAFTWHYNGSAPNLQGAQDQ